MEWTKKQETYDSIEETCELIARREYEDMTDRLNAWSEELYRSEDGKLYINCWGGPRTIYADTLEWPESGKSAGTVTIEVSQEDADAFRRGEWDYRQWMRENCD